LNIILRDGLKLYYNILKIHRKVLPPEMKKIGNLYLRIEFKHHHESPNLNYYRKFYTKWNEYYINLANKGLKAVARNIDEREENLLTKDQK